LFSPSCDAIGPQWRILTRFDGQIAVELEVFLRRFDGGGQISGGDARDGQEDDRSCFQQNHFVKICTMTVMNVGVWYCVRTIQRTVGEAERRREERLFDNGTQDTKQSNRMRSTVCDQLPQVTSTGLQCC